MNVRPSAIILKDSHILTLRYCYGDQDVYALPGGNPDPGESLNAALSRELNEELGVMSDINEMIICGEVIWEEVQKETLHIVFHTKITGKPTLNPAETTAQELVWLPIEDLDKNLLYPNVGKQIQDFATMLTPSGHIGVIDQPYIK
ncbi:NUDIX domain-containing protein [Dyadobacter sp. CY347]|uniref:NUDIX domain-containing protein n=1 Tax=Dyadobacter sp. CY347 TaxID=2909336 RepID=UPI001F35142E|nr:NUDIX hydrolase [Dyadobacter sp. CY347]MCF2489542.1 NUDIX hydrolase [Dyadobacter sp. CY347]